MTLKFFLLFIIRFQIHECGLLVLQLWLEQRGYFHKIYEHHFLLSFISPMSFKFFCICLYGSETSELLLLWNHICQDRVLWQIWCCLPLWHIKLKTFLLVYRSTHLDEFDKHAILARNNRKRRKNILHCILSWGCSGLQPTGIGFFIRCNCCLSWNLQ